MESLTSKIYGPRVIHIRSMDVGSCRYKYKGFCKKFMLPKSINRERKTHASLVENSSLSSLPLMVTSVLEEIK